MINLFGCYIIMCYLCRVIDKRVNNALKITDRFTITCLSDIETYFFYLLIKSFLLYALDV